MLKTKKTILATLAIVGLVGTVAFAGPFGGYTLPAWQGNAYTPKGEKQSNYTYSYLETNKMTNTDQVTGWVDNGNGTQISDDFSFSVGDKKDMYHDPGYTSGYSIRNGMENAHFYKFERAWVDGWYNYN